MDLKAFRESLGLSQDDLAGELGLAGKGRVSQIETGAVPATIKLALKIEAWSGGVVRATELLAPEDAQLHRAAIERQPAEAAA